LEIFHNEFHVGNSPYEVLVSKDYSSFTQPTRIVTREQAHFRRPYSLVFSPEEKLYVSDLEANKIVVLDGQLSPSASLEPEGVLKSPAGLAFSELSQLFVANSGAGRIEQLDQQSGKVLFFWKEALLAPKGVAYFEGSIFVSDTEHHRIHLFDTKGRLFKNFGSRGSKPGEFLYPTALAFHEQMELLAVCDTQNHRIQLFDPEGTFKKAIGKPGNGDGELQEPSGVAFDHDGNLFVADTKNHRIQIFDRNGRLLHKLGRRGKGPGEFEEPLGVCVSQYGTLVVADSGNSRVQAF